LIRLDRFWISVASNEITYKFQKKEAKEPRMKKERNKESLYLSYACLLRWVIVVPGWWRQKDIKDCVLRNTVICFRNCLYKGMLTSLLASVPLLWRNASKQVSDVCRINTSFRVFTVVIQTRNRRQRSLYCHSILQSMNIPKLV